MHKNNPPAGERKMDDAALQRWVEAVSLCDFGKPFLHRAVFNHRLRTTGGRYFLSDHRIEINPKHLEQLGEETVLGIIRHELCHYHLHREGKGYRHRDRDFKELLARVKGLRHAPPLPGQRASRRKGFEIICTRCGQRVYRQRRIDPQKYACGACRGDLTIRPLTDR